jgi:2EXR family
MDEQYKAEDAFLFSSDWHNSLSTPAPTPFTPRSKSDVTTATFPLFSLLPKDIRLEIWELCHPPPRNVVLAFPQEPTTRARWGDWDKRWVFAPLPISHFSTLLVNHESRDFFLSHYLRIFADFPSNEEKKREGRKAGWYFNLRKDSLCFGDGVRGFR